MLLDQKNKKTGRWKRTEETIAMYSHHLPNTTSVRSEVIHMALCLNVKVDLCKITKRKTEIAPTHVFLI